jgi:hypothetical protein
MSGTIFAERRRPCAKCGKKHPDERYLEFNDADGDYDQVLYEMSLDQWRESEIVFGEPRCWECCSLREQSVILKGLLSDAA